MKYKINLFSSKKESFLEKAIYFSLNYLRYILVITQTVVIFVFFYKFKVDQEIIDLEEAIGQKKEIVNVTEPLFKQGQEFELILNYLKKIYQEQENLDGIMEYLFSNFPKDLFLTKLELKKELVLMEGYAFNSTLIELFYKKLKNDKKFREVNLISINKSELGFNFVLKLINYNNNLN
ncbi:MAG: PilN domain-containing protein [Patescibacteria group bacterium]|nr:PilN domain-containing protein [Patescibacteria group bacterium]